MKRAVFVAAALEAVAILGVAALFAIRAADRATPDRVPDEAPPAAAGPAADPAAGATSGTSDDRSPDIPAPPQAPAPDAPPVLGPDPAGTLLFGKVIDGEGRPIGKADLSLQGPDGPARSAAVIKGAYAIAGLGPGTWSVRAYAREHRQIRETIDIPPAAPRVRRDFTLRRAIILKIRFRTPGGEPLAEALETMKSDDCRPIFPTAVATPDPPAGDFPLSASSQIFIAGGGWYRARGNQTHDETPAETGVDGTIELASDLPVHVSAVLRHVVLATELAPPGLDTVTLVVDPQRILGSLASVRLRVIDGGTKEPVTKARIALTDRQMGGGGRPPGPDGVLVFENVRPGLLALEINAPGREWVQQIVRVAPGRLNDLGDYELAAGIEITGRIVDGAGQPVTCGVSACRLDRMTFPQAFDFGWHTCSGPDGVFRMSGLGRGRHLVRVTGDSHARVAVVIDTTNGPVSDVVLATGAGAMATLAVKVPPGARWLIRVLDSFGALLESTDLWTDHDLKCRLLPGFYRVEVYEGDELRKSLPLVAADRPVTVEVSP